MTVYILGDLIADINLHAESFPINAKDIQRLTHLELGPGGATNIAIMAARFGLAVTGLGEVGNDNFGEVVRSGLQREGVDIAKIKVTPGVKTPVAGVLVDKKGEPAYLGFPGSLQVKDWPDEWSALVRSGEALYADGWAEYKETPALILRGFEQAKGAGVPVFFDPGPGNPEVDSAWVRQGVALTHVLLVNRAEAKRLAGDVDDDALMDKLLTLGPSWVVLKRGPHGLVIGNKDQRAAIDGFKVTVRDTTGAGDSVSGAMLYGILRQLPVEKLAVLANATGAAKVQRLGTGHNLPTMAEVAAMLTANGYHADNYLPS